VLLPAPTLIFRTLRILTHRRCVPQVVDTILSSTTRLVANRAAWADTWKRRKIEDLALLLQGALAARRKVGLKMNLHRDALDTVRGPPAARPGPHKQRQNAFAVVVTELGAAMQTWRCWAACTALHAAPRPPGARRARPARLARAAARAARTTLCLGGGLVEGLHGMHLRSILRM